MGGRHLEAGGVDVAAGLGGEIGGDFGGDRLRMICNIHKFGGGGLGGLLKLFKKTMIMY